MKDLLSLDKGTLKTVISALQEFSLWLTLALAVIFACVFVITYFKNKEGLATLKKVTVGVVIGYCITLIALILYIQIVRMKVKGEIDGNFFLFVGFFALMLLLVLTGAILGKYTQKAYKYFSYIALAVIIVYGVILLSTIPTADTDYQPKDNVGYYIFSTLLVVAIVILTMLFGKDNGTASNTKQIVYAGVCISLSFALSYVKFFSLPMGGSVTLVSMLPLMLYSYMFGAKKGVFAGVIYGILQCIQSPQFYQPMQVLLDYPIAFSAIGLAGVFKNVKFFKKDAVKFAVGMVIAVLFRYCAHVISGYYVFYTWSTMKNQLAYSFAYNTFTLVDLVLDIIVGVPLLTVPSLKKTILSVNPNAERE